MIRQLQSRFLAWNEGWAVAAPGRLSSGRKASTACRMLTNPLKILIEQTIANGAKLILALLSDTSVSISHFFSSGLKRSIRIQSNGSLSLLPANSKRCHGNNSLNQQSRSLSQTSTPRLSTLRRSSAQERTATWFQAGQSAGPTLLEYHGLIRIYTDPSKPYGAEKTRLQ